MLERFFNKFFHQETAWTTEKQDGNRFRVDHFPGLSGELPQLMGSLGEVEIESQSGDTVTMDICLKEPLKVEQYRPVGNKGPVFVKSIYDNGNVIRTPGLEVKVLSPIESGETKIKLELELKTTLYEGGSINLEMARGYVKYLADTLEHPWIVVNMGK